MVVVKAFPAIRPPAKLASQVACQPYDVLSSEEARIEANANPYSFLHIDKSEVDLPEEIDHYSDEVYQKAKDNLASFLAEGKLIKEETAQLYLYELTMNGRSQTGIVARTAIDDYRTGKIKRHEFTLPAKEEDRINHFKWTNANTSPIFLTYHAKEQIQTIIEDYKREHAPIYDFTAYYDVQHRVFAIRDLALIGQLERLFAQVDSLYIADGHHRSSSAVRVGLEKRAQAEGLHPEAAYNFFLSVIFPDNELEILDYNRVVKNSLPDHFWAQVAEDFEIEKIEKSKPAQVHDIHAYTKEGWVRLRAKEIETDEIKSLDVQILQDKILSPLLSIENPKTDPNISFVGGIRGLDELEKEVNNGATIAFAMFAPTMEQLLAVADAGKIMPAKSTWFEPKLLSGLFLHDLG